MQPSKVKLLRSSAELELTYTDQVYRLSAEYLRVHSPSAEVRGHGRGQQELQYGKRDVKLTGVEPVGNYGVKLIFDDGHNSGIYTWAYLYDLSQNYAHHWKNHLDALERAGKSRDAHTQTLKFPTQN